MSSLPAVLVVDDEPGVCRMMSRVLTEAGYRVYSANCGEEALVIACQLGERLGLVVTDIRMPTMDGVELASYLGRLEPPPRLLFVSAIDRLPKDRLPGPLLIKPFRADHLQRHVEKMLGPARAPSLPAAG
jgi:CheY-like chemotaxis protein